MHNEQCKRESYLSVSAGMQETDAIGLVAAVAGGALEARVAGVAVDAPVLAVVVEARVGDLLALWAAIGEDENGTEIENQFVAIGCYNCFTDKPSRRASNLSHLHPSI